MDKDILAAILNSLIEPVVFVDTSHVIRYLNKAALQRYDKRGGADLIGKSIFDYHNDRSKQIILDNFQSFVASEDESYLITNKRNEKVFMRAVRNSEGRVIGYYERFEKVLS